MSKTPETDKAWKINQDAPHSPKGDPWALASRLERDRDEWKRKFGDVREALCDALPESNHPTMELVGMLKGERDGFRDELSKVMPADFKDWHQNSPSEWPVVARMVIESLREREDAAYNTVDELRERVAELESWIATAAPVMESACCIAIEENVSRLGEIAGCRGIIETCPVEFKSITKTKEAK
jgi:hypothetical protein